MLRNNSSLVNEILSDVTFLSSPVFKTTLCIFYTSTLFLLFYLFSFFYFFHFFYFFANMKFSKFSIALLIVGALLLMTTCSRYNSAVVKDEAVETTWSNVETQYQRRADLIGNLVETVKSYKDFEQETLIKVTEARANATSINISADNLTPENIKAFEQAQTGLSGALKSLLAVSENYPDLKANQNYLKLQDELAGTENRIAVARTNFNESVNGFNRYVRTFPNNVILGLFGMGKKGYFESAAGAENAPDVGNMLK